MGVKDVRSGSELCPQYAGYKLETAKDTELNGRETHATPTPFSSSTFNFTYSTFNFHRYNPLAQATVTATVVSLC
eukprot:scaffold18587_cov46-Cyclotella_meneghiniana.AAC.1